MEAAHPERARSNRFNHTRSIAEKEKEYTESHNKLWLNVLKDQQSRIGEKEKSYCNTGYSYLVTHPSTNVAEQGLTLLKLRNMLLSLWYIQKTNKTLCHIFLQSFDFR